MSSTIFCLRGAHPPQPQYFMIFSTNQRPRNWLTRQTTHDTRQRINLMAATNERPRQKQRSKSKKEQARERTKKNNDRDKISWDNAIVKLHSEVHFGK